MKFFLFFFSPGKLFPGKASNFSRQQRIGRDNASLRLPAPSNRSQLEWKFVCRSNGGALIMTPRHHEERGQAG